MKKVLFILLTGLFLFGIKNFVNAIAPEYEFFDSNLEYLNFSSPQTEPSQNHIYLYPQKDGYLNSGTILPIKYIIRSPFKDASGLVLKVYVLPAKVGVNMQNDYFTYEDATFVNGMSWGCEIPNSKFFKVAKLVYQKSLGTIEAQNYVAGEFKIKIDKNNGFVENKAPSIMGNKYNIQSAVVGIVEDKQGNFYSDDMMSKGVKTICDYQFGVQMVKKGVIKTDLAVVNLTASPSILSSNDFVQDLPIKFNVTVKNVGSKNSGSNDSYLCLRKRNHGHQSPVFSNYLLEVSGENGLLDGPFKKICRKMANIGAGKSKKYEFIFNSKNDVFKNSYAMLGFEDGNVGLDYGDNNIVANIVYDGPEITQDNNNKAVSIKIKE